MYNKYLGEGNTDYMKRLTGVCNTFPWLYEFMMLPIDTDAAGNFIYRQIHPDNHTGENGMAHIKNFPRAKNQFPGLQLSDIAGMTPEQRNIIMTEYNIYYSHILITIAECRLRRYPGAATE
jgi:hypothetical protein